MFYNHDNSGFWIFFTVCTKKNSIRKLTYLANCRKTWTSQVFNVSFFKKNTLFINSPNI